MAQEDQTKAYISTTLPSKEVAKDIADRRGQILEDFVSYVAQVREGEVTWPEVFESNKELGQDFTRLVTLEHALRVRRFTLEKDTSVELDAEFQESIGRGIPSIDQVISAGKVYLNELDKVSFVSPRQRDTPPPPPEDATDPVHYRRVRVATPTAVDDLAEQKGATVTQPLRADPSRRTTMQPSIGDSIEDVLQNDAERDYRRDTTLDANIFEDVQREPRDTVADMGPIQQDLERDHTMIAPEGYDHLAESASDRRRTDVTVEIDRRGVPTETFSHAPPPAQIEIEPPETDFNDEAIMAANEDEGPDEYVPPQKVVHTHDPEVMRRFGISLTRFNESMDRQTQMFYKMNKVSAWKNVLVAGLVGAIGALGMYALLNEREQDEFHQYRNEITILEQTVDMQQELLAQTEVALADAEAGRLDGIKDTARAAYLKAGQEFVDALTKAKQYEKSGKFRGPIASEFSDRKPLLEVLVGTFEHNSQRGVSFLNDQRTSYNKESATLQSYMKLSDAGFCARPAPAKATIKRSRRGRTPAPTVAPQPTETWGEIIE